MDSDQPIEGPRNQVSNPPRGHRFARLEPPVLAHVGIDTAALVRALKSGKISAAGLDVLPQEPLLRDEAEIFRGGHSLAQLHTLLASNVLLQFPNVLVTPHNACNTEDAVHRIIETTLANIEAFARGAVRNVVS